MPSSGKVPATVGALRWGLTLCGLWLFVLAILALSGPGRIDIMDGQARYLVARSLVEHGDPAIREADFWFCVLPGRDGNHYSLYRFPHSLLGVPTIWLADAIGPVSELRRQFFFTLIGAFLGALLAVVYAVWFRGQGHSPAAAVGWALAGIFCTPNWFYATSTFDDLLGSLLVVTAVVLAWWGRQSRPLVGATLAGLVLGLAVNAKQPLGMFVLPVLALVVTANRRWPTRLGGVALLLGGLALGVAAYLGYEWYKFPPGTTADHARLLDRYVPAWPGNMLAGLTGLLLSPAAGVFWYCPPLLLGLAGLLRWRKREPRFCAALFVALAGYVLFISSMSFFKGDLCWGPRYLTPLFALLWLFVPTAALVWPHRLTFLVLGLGLLVQLLALSVEPLRLYVTHRLESGYFYGHEWIHCHPALGHLFNRPREILEICADDGTNTTAYSPSPILTSSAPLLEEMERGPEAVRKYRFLASFRPWWISQTWLAPADRPVALGQTVALLLGLALAGAILLLATLRRQAGRVLEDREEKDGQRRIPFEAASSN
jgi:hypothetical protein